MLLMATGSEVQWIVAAEKTLAEQGIKARLVSMPCWELFKEQSADYRESILPMSITKRLSVEMGVSLGWHQWVGDAGDVMALDRYGASAPANRIMQELGFTAENVAARALKLLGK
jgi:transketolase